MPKLTRTSSRSALLVSAWARSEGTPAGPSTWSATASARPSGKALTKPTPTVSARMGSSESGSSSHGHTTATPSAVLNSPTTARRSSCSFKDTARAADATATQTRPTPDRYFTSAPSVKPAPESTPLLDRANTISACRLNVTMSTSLCALAPTSNSTSGFQASMASAVVVRQPPERYPGQAEIGQQQRVGQQPLRHCLIDNRRAAEDARH